MAGQVAINAAQRRLLDGLAGVLRVSQVALANNTADARAAALALFVGSGMDELYVVADDVAGWEALVAEKLGSANNVHVSSPANLREGGLVATNDEGASFFPTAAFIDMVRGKNVLLVAERTKPWLDIDFSTLGGFMLLAADAGAFTGGDGKVVGVALLGDDVTPVNKLAVAGILHNRHLYTFETAGPQDVPFLPREKSGQATLIGLAELRRALENLSGVPRDAPAVTRANPSVADEFQALVGEIERAIAVRG